MKWFVRATGILKDIEYNNEKAARDFAKKLEKQGHSVNVFSKKQGLSLGKLFSNYGGNKSKDDEV